jgi:hypothetical protein
LIEPLSTADVVVIDCAVCVIATGGVDVTNEPTELVVVKFAALVATTSK